MACYFTDNVHTRTFTPKEFQVELLESAKSRNIIVCLSSESNRSFIALKLIQELSTVIRLRWDQPGRKRTLFIGDISSVKHHAHIIRCLTDLNVGEYTSLEQQLDLKSCQVICTTSEVCQHWIACGIIKWSYINLLILDDCHNVIRSHTTRKIALGLKESDLIPRILGLTGPLFINSTEPASVEAEVKHLEKDLRCLVESASEIVSVLRYSAHPQELLVEYASPNVCELSSKITKAISQLREFIDDHRYDPSEIYADEEFLEEIKDIPDPKKDPYEIMGDLMYVLETMGPWCADKAALLLLIHIEKLKVKTPYERHYLLLCLVSTVLLSIRVMCEHHFHQYPESERIYRFSSPKVLRLIEIVRQFKPKKTIDSGVASIEKGNEDLPNSVETDQKNIEVCKTKEGDLNSETAMSEVNGDSEIKVFQECQDVGRTDNNTSDKDQNKNITLMPDKNENCSVKVKSNCISKKSDCDDKIIKNLSQNGVPSILDDKCDNVIYCRESTDLNNLNIGVKNICIGSKQGCESNSTEQLNANVVNNNFDLKRESSQSKDSVEDNTLLDGGTVEEEFGDRWEVALQGFDDEFNDFKEELNSFDDVCIKGSLKSAPFAKAELDPDHEYLDHYPKASTDDAKEIEKTGTDLDCLKVDEVTESECDDQPVACNSNGLTDDERKGPPGEIVQAAGGQTKPDGWKSGFRWKGRGRGWRLAKKGEPRKNYSLDDADSLCGIIFVNNRFTAKVMFHLLNDLRKVDTEFSNIITQYTVEKTANPLTDLREAEIEHRKQEDVLKRFRMRECNLVVATSVLEEGIELPRCNLVVRYDPANGYRSHANSKARAKQLSSCYIFMVEESEINDLIPQYAQYMHIEKLLLSHCSDQEPSEVEEIEADYYTDCVPSYQPCEGENSVSVNLSSAIALVNRYCAKLPSDTFTRLSPIWSVQPVEYNNQNMFVCSLRLPINSPVKNTIMGHPMPNRALARRIAALETCKVLHSKGELDNQLEPIGKEAFNCLLDEDEITQWDPNLPRPGTTKSRQYYYKKIASCLNDCRPMVGQECKLYHIEMTLTCPLPEEQNTRGRKLHPPELSPQSFGILTTKEIPKVCPFPIFTRSGEVRINLKLCEDSVVPDERQIQTMAAFLNFIFTSVLRLQKYLMSFDPEARENSFFIVPTKKNEKGVNEVDWEFLEVIYERRGEAPKHIPEEERKQFQFEAPLYADAVVMPWYRNQDQPQYFYVAEICHQLNAKSSFPGSSYHTFEDYYLKKYNIQIQNLNQPLLDVDHTSARLNFLTPRYVNRKGVALPTSSEETKRAKRENLEQKQILVPELCMVHVVPASLWRQAVCLPCVLYRINALLLADEIRTAVAREMALGVNNLPQDFEWTPLDFGWSLADVLKKSREANEKKDPESNELDELKPEEPDAGGDEIVEPNPEDEQPEDKNQDDKGEEEGKEEEGTPSEGGEKPDGWIEIGTWSNDMVLLGEAINNDLADENITMVRYGSPTSWDVGGGGGNANFYCSDVESDDSSSLDDISVKSDRSYDATTFRIKYRGDYLAEAEDQDTQLVLPTPHDKPIWNWPSDDVIEELKDEISSELESFSEATNGNVDLIKANKMFIPKSEKFIVNRDAKKKNSCNPDSIKKELPFNVKGYGLPDEMLDSGAENNNHCALKATDSGYIEILHDEIDGELTFSFDYQPDLDGHPGPSPSLILQALTMSNANDGINLERLETIGDSFLKYAITTYLYCSYEKIHEGKLSHLRSKQVSNLNLYRLGRKKVFGESMIATKFEPHDNWLPPCYLVPRDSEQAILDADPSTTLPYNLVTQHSIPDKSIADCVEALIGAYLIACGPRGALIFMSWLGIKVLPKTTIEFKNEETADQAVRLIGSTPVQDGVQVIYGKLEAPKSPLVRNIPDPEGELEQLLSGFEALENKLRYKFNDRAYLLQAMTHASYSSNRITDCYQRLEFLGDAVLDYLITRHLYEDHRAHSPGALTDLRSALVNNTIFASLAVRHGLHKFFRHLSPALGEVVQRFVTIQEENSHTISEEYYLVGEEAEDIEVPKALGDVFESIAGAIFLDSNMSLDTVWKVYYRMMKREIEQFSNKVPKSPIRELLELEPETAKFGKPEKLADGRRVRVTVEVFGKGTYKGIGRNYRIAKCTAAKCALKQLKKKGLLSRGMSYFNNPQQQWSPQN